MDILQIDKTNIKLIAAFVEANKNLCNDLVSNFKGSLLRQEVNKDWLKFIIKNDAIIKSIVIDCQNGKVTSIAFSGMFNITYGDLVGLFGKGVEYYERYDDAFEFIFTNNTTVNNYSLKCFVLYDDKQKANWQNEKLGNLSIHLE